MMKGSKRVAALAAPLLAITLAFAANATDIPVPRSCGATTSGESLSDLRPTLLIVAENYEKQAKEYTVEAERYRMWASAEEIFGTGAYGKRYAATYYERHAEELDGAAAESRLLAAKYRRLADTAPAQNVAEGC
jgi:hypothetical protein